MVTPRRGSTARVAASLIVALIAALTVGPVMVRGATLTNAWQARLGTAGANGTATIRVYMGGTGSIALKLARFRAVTTLPVTLSKGTCSSIGSTLIRFPAIRTTSAGAAVRTSALTASQVTLILAATAGTGRMAIRVGSSATGGARCAAFSTLAVPAYVAATIPIVGGPEGPTVDVNAAGLFVLSGSDGTVTRVDPITNALTTYPLQVTGDEVPDSIAYGEGALWVTMYWSNHPGAVERLDPATGAVLARIQAGSGCGVVTSPGAVWTADARSGGIVRIDPATNQVSASVPAGDGVCDTQFALGSIWAPSDEAGAIWRIDPATNTVAARIPLVLAPDDYFSLGFAFGSAWAIDDDGNVVRIDPATNQVAATIATTGGLADLDSGADSIWVSNRGTEGQPDGVLSRIDPATGSVTATIPVGINPGSIAFAGGYVWVALQGEPTVVQVNAATNKVQARFNVGGIPSGLVTTDHAVWVSVTAESTDPNGPPSDRLVRINY